MRERKPRWQGPLGALSRPVGQGRLVAREKALSVEARPRFSGRSGCYRAIDRGPNAPQGLWKGSWQSRAGLEPVLFSCVVTPIHPPVCSRS
jgi:hypothetical protein